MSVNPYNAITSRLYGLLKDIVNDRLTVKPDSSMPGEKVNRMLSYYIENIQVTLEMMIGMEKEWNED